MKNESAIREMPKIAICNSRNRYSFMEFSVFIICFLMMFALSVLIVGFLAGEPKLTPA